MRPVITDRQCLPPTEPIPPARLLLLPTLRSGRTITDDGLRDPLQSFRNLAMNETHNLLTRRRLRQPTTHRFRQLKKLELSGSQSIFFLLVSTINKGNDCDCAAGYVTPPPVNQVLSLALLRLPWATMLRIWMLPSAVYLHWDPTYKQAQSINNWGYI